MSTEELRIKSLELSIKIANISDDAYDLVRKSEIIYNYLAGNDVTSVDQNA